MVTSGDTETSVEVVDDSPNCSLPLQRSPVGLNTTKSWDTKNQEDIEPVDVLVPVRPRDGLVSDVWLLWVVLRVSVGLILAGHGRRLRGEEFWLDCLHAGGGLVRGHGCGCSMCMCEIGREQRMTMGEKKLDLRRFDCKQQHKGWNDKECLKLERGG